MPPSRPCAPQAQRPTPPPSLSQHNSERLSLPASRQQAGRAPCLPPCLPEQSVYDVTHRTKMESKENINNFAAVFVVRLALQPLQQTPTRPSSRAIKDVWITISVRWSGSDACVIKAYAPDKVLGPRKRVSLPFLLTFLPADSRGVRMCGCAARVAGRVGDGPPQDDPRTLLYSLKETDKSKYKAKPQFGLKGLNMPGSCHQLGCRFESAFLQLLFFLFGRGIVPTRVHPEGRSKAQRRCTAEGDEGRLERGARVGATPGDSTL